MAEGTPIAHRGPVTLDDALPLLQAKVAEKGGADSFKVRVQRQASLSSPLIQIASFANASIDQLSNPETWLPMLAGGGPFFLLTTTHSSETIPTVAFRPSNLNGEPREVDVKVTADPNWRGPPDMTFPSSSDKPARAVDDAAARSLFKFLGTAASGADGAARGPTMQSAGGSGDLDTRLRLVEAQHRFEMDQVAKQIEAQGKAAERQIAALAEIVKSVAARPVEPPKSLASQLVDLAPVITAFGAILSPVIAKRGEVASEERKRLAEIEARREERERADRGDIMKMMQVTSERASTAGNDMMKVIAPMVDAVSQMGRTVLQQVATMRELTTQEPQDEGLTGLAKAGIAAFGEYMAAKASAPAGASGGVPPPRQLSPQQAPPDDHLTELRDSDPAELLGQIEAALKEHHEAGELVEGFLDVVKANAAAAKIVTDAGGPLAFFRAQLGDEWLGVKENMAYIQQVVSTLAIAARRRDN